MRKHGAFKIAAAIFLLIAATPAFAATYKIKIQTADPESVYETNCAQVNSVCITQMRFPFKQRETNGFIDAGFVVRDWIFSAEFKMSGHRLSTSAQGWDSFTESIEDISSGPKAVKLYAPRSSAQGDYPAHMELVLRPGNAYVTTVLVSVDAQK